MTSTQFKNKLRELKDFLIGKEIRLTFATKQGIESFTFNTVRSFGLKVLELEQLGAGFSISKVGNAYVEKRTVTENELTKWVKDGVWTKVFIHASIL